jgi:hypothetical protein
MNLLIDVYPSSKPANPRRCFKAIIFCNRLQKKLPAVQKLGVIQLITRPVFYKICSNRLHESAVPVWQPARRELAGCKILVLAKSKSKVGFMQAWA